MRKLILFFVAVVAQLSALSQTDTLVTLNRKKIPCKIFEISDYEIKYRAGTDGPIVVTDRSNFYKYILSDGYTEVLVPEEMIQPSLHSAIMDHRQVIKIHPFGFAFSHFSMAYESVIKPGTNLDVEAGYINSEMSANHGTTLSGRISGNPLYSGGYIKPGIKFLILGENSARSLRYGHPVKGSYFKFDLAFSFVNYQGIERTFYTQTNNGGYYTSSSTTQKTDLKTSAYGGFVNYGYQTILGNLITMEFYIGLGFTGQSYSYSNPAYVAAMKAQNYYIDSDLSQLYNYHGFLRNPSTGLAFTSGFRLGILLPSKKPTNLSKN